MKSPVSISGNITELDKFMTQFKTQAEERSETGKVLF